MGLVGMRTFVVTIGFAAVLSGLGWLCDKHNYYQRSDVLGFQVQLPCTLYKHNAIACQLA